MLKKWILRIGLLFLVILLSIVAYLAINRDSIKEKTIMGLNSALDAKVEVNGVIDITLFSTFPKITLEFNDVFIEDKVKASDTLVQMAKVNFSINPLSLLKDTITLNSIHLKNGQVNLHVFKDGQTNFDILKTKEVKDSTSSVSLNLENVQITDVRLSYADDKTKSYFEGFINDAQISGQFQDKDIALIVDLNADNTSFKLSETQFLHNNILEVKAEFDYVNDGECFIFKENEILIDNNQFSVNGNFCADKNTIELTANSEGSNIENAIKLVPADLFDLSQFKGDGKYFIEVQLSSKLNKPNIKVNFSVEDANLSLEDFPLKATEVYCSGTYSNSPKANLVLKDFDFKMNKSNLKGNVIFPNLKERKMILKTDGVIFTEDIDALELKNISFEDDGKIALKELNFDFSYRQKDSTWIASKLTGDIKFENIKGELSAINKSFECNADLTALARQIKVKKCAIKIGENDIDFNGELQNALNYFQDNLFKTNEPLVVNGSLSSNVFDINSFLEKKPKNDNKEITDLLKWLNISSNLDLKIATLKYKNLEIKNLKSKVKSNKPGTFNIKNLTANGLGGSASGNIELRFFKDKTLEVSLNSKLSKIDISKLFVAFDNFDQKTITNKNIKGLINADLLVSMSFKNFTEFEAKDLLVQSDFSIQKGELIQLKSLESMSKYLSVDQLKHIYFSEYKSELKIADRVLYLENNKIKSNVLSMDFGGSHSFDNIIDYTVKLNLTNILAAKFKKNKTLQEDYVNDVGGGINIFLSMKGDLDNPEIKMVKRKAFKDEKKENKKPLIDKEDLKEYFKKDDPNKIDEKEFYFEEDEEEEFINFDE